MSTPLDDAALQEMLARAFPGRRATLDRHVRLSAGASRLTVALDATVEGRPERLILQIDADTPASPDGEATATPRFLGVAGQAAVLQRAAAAGAPVPPVVWADPSGDVLAAPALLSARIDGETLPRRILRDPALAGARARFAADCGRILAAVHRAEVDGLDLPAPDPLDALRRSLDETGEPRPAFELAYAWLVEHRPAPGAVALVHGDFRLGNLIVGPDGVRAVLDWELAHLGDPLEDLGWLCSIAWRFGEALPVGGMGQRDELYAAYQAAGGDPVDPAAARWWETFAALSWGVICMRQARRHLSGASRSMELAAIGRRVCESEWDLLGLLPSPASTPDPGRRPRPAPTAQPDPAAQPDPTGGLHGRPTAGELLDAVAEWLEGDIGPRVGEEHRFHVRVATNVLRTVVRELALGPSQSAANDARLAALGYPDDAALASAIRSGALEPGKDAQVRAAIETEVTDRLAVANPRYLEQRAPSA
ncbi:phosphotransferase [Acidiferrimicrobium sp. IK]|uniref:phosphotransferase family protein n=1 Tax=Acidiferrimicrobium sp. IK TaxID=2871700 RepID=UPI0021CB8ACB|nr:phosphotransferase [Acidiferrimicrobium sp. IK]MCU4185064.1 phosphotransferase [Acidiferrimicrobium sp. IK]